MSASSAPATVERGKITKKGIAADHPTWCPGCGDFAVLAAFFKTLEKLQFPQENIVTIAGIGCSSRFQTSFQSSVGGGLSLFNGKRFKSFDLSDFNIDNSISLIKSIKSDKKGNIWVGTELGVSVFDPRTRTFSRPINSKELNGNILEDPNDPTRYQLKTISNTAGTILPSIGLQFEF